MSGLDKKIPSVAVTGGIACGKSTLGNLLSGLGADVLDADDLVHRLQCPGGSISLAVAREFGKEYLSGDGSVDRIRLGAYVFSDRDALQKLNAMTHPLVRESFDKWFATPSTAWARVGLIPLLFESGLESCWDFTVCVASIPDVQLRRMKDRGWSDEDCSRRLKAQWPLERKMAKSDYVIHNDGGMAELAAEAELLKQRILKEKVKNG